MGRVVTSELQRVGILSKVVAGRLMVRAAGQREDLARHLPRRHVGMPMHALRT